MARTNINAINGPGPYATTGVEIQAAAVAADVANGNATVHPGRGMLLVAFNTGGVAYTVTITSVADSLGRSGDVNADSIAAGQAKVYGPFPAEGWKQAADGNLYYSASNAAVKFTPIYLDTRGLSG